MASKARIQQALVVAKQARLRAHAPYSGFQVGAALLIEGQKEPVPGCNVENASFGATVCAERSAVLSARSQLGSNFKPELLVVTTSSREATVPCALCLQVLAEFCSDEMPILLANLSGVLREGKLKDFLPYPFRSFEVTTSTSKVKPK